MKSKITIILFLLMILIVPLASAKNLTIEPNGFNIGLYGGEKVSGNITIKWEGEDNAPVYLYYNVSQKNSNYIGEELKINFSENLFFMNNNQVKSIKITIITLPYIEPDNYTITIEGITEIEEIRKKVSRGGGGSTPIFPPIIEEDNETTEENITESPSNMPPEFENVSSEKAKTQKEEEEGTNNLITGALTAAEFLTGNIWAAIIFGIIVLGLLFYFFFKKKRRK